MIFVDRNNEMEAIKERLKSESQELIIVYGRRRIGKTTLVLRSIEGPHVYYLATEGRNNVVKFKQEAQKVFPEVRYAGEDWESIFHALKDKVIVIDEFPYLIQADKAVPSIFQKVVDEVVKGSKTKLILLGSSISAMRDLQSYKSPLYGRRTSSIEVRELKFKELNGFGFHLLDAIRIYGFAGGVPFYLSKVKSPFLEWVNQEFRKVDSFIRDEVDFLLRYEFREISTYKEILLGVATGKNTLGEIRDFVGVGGEISSYLKKLERIGIVKREVPVLERERSKKGRYVIADKFVNFWFKFVYPNLSEIEEGKYQLKEDEYNEYLGRVFEEVSTQYLKDRYGLRKVGRHWYKDIEIDILDKHLKVAGECKWSEDVDGVKVLYHLKEKLRRLNLTSEKLVVFGKSFSRTEESDEVEYIDLKKLEKWYREI